MYIFFAYISLSNNWSQNVYELVSPCPTMGPDFELSLVAMTLLLFEDFTAKYHHSLTIKRVHRYSIEEV